MDPAPRRRFHTHVTFGPISADVLGSALEHIFPEVGFSPVEVAALQQSRQIVEEILANARSRDRTRDIRF